MKNAGIVFFALGFLAESVAGIREQLQSLRGAPRFGAHQPSPMGRSLEPLTPPSPVQGSSRQMGESQRSSSDARPRRPGGAEGRQSQTERRGGPSRSRRSSDRSVASPAADTRIRRRTLESSASASPVQPADSESPVHAETESPMRDEAKPVEQPSRDLAPNDLFSESGMSKMSGGATESGLGSPPAEESVPPPPESANIPSESPVAPRNPQPFGRRNRR